MTKEIESTKPMNQLAVSLAGHDKGCIYVVVSQDEDAVYLADGGSKKLDKPKKKNPRHIRSITHLPAEVLEALDKARRDSDIVHVLRLYRSLVSSDDRAGRTQ